MDIDLEESMQPMDNSVILRLHSPHMDQGFPGKCFDVDCAMFLLHSSRRITQHSPWVYCFLPLNCKL